MSVMNFVDPENCIVLTVCAGNLTASELVSSFTELKQNPDFRPEFHQLIDLSPVAESDLDFKALFDLQRNYDPFSRDSRRAIVAPHNVSFGMARMYQSILDSHQLEVFRSTVDAIRWLGLDITTLERALRAKKPRRGPPRLARRKGKAKGSTG